MVKSIIFLLIFHITMLHATIYEGFYADITDKLIVSPVSASLAASDLSTGSGISVESTPGNLPYDSCNHLSLSYAGFFGNTFNTSIISYHGKPAENIGVGLLLGYIYVPDIINTNASESTEDGSIREVKLSYFSASRILIRAGVGRIFHLPYNITLGAGVALNAKRVRLPETGYGLGLDAGLKCLFNKPHITLAMQLENITSSYTYWNHSFQERAYHHCRVGIGYERFVSYLYGSVTLNYASPDLFANEGINSVTIDKTENDTPDETIGKDEIYENPFLILRMGRYGIEYQVMNVISFRMGFHNFNYSFGAGLQVLQNRAGIDIAYITHALAGTYQVAINYIW